MTPLTVVVGNGAFGSPLTLGAVMKRFVQSAAEQGVYTTAIMHSDPYFGNSSYADSYRAARLDAVVRNTANTHETPVHLIGHSWSWNHTLEATAAHPEAIASLAGYTPTGHQAQLEAAWGDLLKRSGMELLHLRQLLSGIGSIASGMAIAEAMIRRLPSDTVRDEMLQAFTKNATPTVLALRTNQPGLPIGIADAKYDKFFGIPDDAKHTLGAAGVLLHTVETTHVGAVTNSHNGEELYGLVSQLASQHDKQHPNHRS